MLALFRSGRQADALAAYAAGRRLLRDELGLEPGAALRALQRDVLAHDPALAWAPPAPCSTVRRPRSPTTSRGACSSSTTPGSTDGCSSPR